MALQRLAQQDHNANLAGCGAGDEPALPMDSRRMQHLAAAVGTLPRGRRQLPLARSSSSGDSSRPQRHLVAILKEDKEAFGFEIQKCLDMATSPHGSGGDVDTPLARRLLLGLTDLILLVQLMPFKLAQSFGLAGDILASINGVNTGGFSHRQIVDLIKSSGNYLRLETVNGAMFLRKMELETKLQLLKQTLQQKWVELRSLLVQEQRLLHGEVTDTALLGTPELEEPWPGGCGTAGPLCPRKPRFSSESSSRSRLSSMTLGSEDSFSQSGAFEDSAAESLSRQSSVDDDCFLPRDGDSAGGRSPLRRNRSISLASSGSMSPLWEGSSCTSSFGTLPRKSRRSSVRKHLLRFIPGLHRAVEEEESRV
ncbi:Cytip [Columba guinea]|nr:Cytip [Columba guinea]